MAEWSVAFSPETPWLELIFRGTIIYLILLVLMRLAGQRESGGLGMSDLLVIVLVGEAAGDAMTGGGTGIADGLIPAATVLAWSVVTDAATYRWPWVTRLLKGRPRPLVVDGRLDRHAMRREFISPDELRTQLRAHGLSDFTQVRRAYLEPNGEISILPVDAQRPDAA